MQNVDGYDETSHNIVVYLPSTKALKVACFWLKTQDLAKCIDNDFWTEI